MAWDGLRFLYSDHLGGLGVKSLTGAQTDMHITWHTIGVLCLSLVHLAIGTFADVGLEPLVLGRWRGLREVQSFQATDATG